jgi:predicted lipid-binding transport protein (Tim44 family)
MYYLPPLTRGQQVRTYLRYLKECFLLAWCAAFQSARNWTGVVGVAVVGVLLGMRGLQMIPTPGWQGEVTIFIIYFIAAWGAFFAARFFLVAPFQLFKKYATPPAQRQLQQFYVEAGILVERKLPKGTPDAEIDAFARETSEWVTGAAQWIAKNISPFAQHRFLDKTDMPAVYYSGAANEKHGNIIASMTRHRKNLQQIIESQDAWK